MVKDTNSRHPLQANVQQAPPESFDVWVENGERVTPRKRFAKIIRLGRKADAERSVKKNETDNLSKRFGLKSGLLPIYRRFFAIRKPGGRKNQFFCYEEQRKFELESQLRKRGDYYLIKPELR